jgi:protein-L-isoaspartate(D-aspartate) O-methyltransferase
MKNNDFALERHRMVLEQIYRRGIYEPRLLDAFEAVPRHLFVNQKSRISAYDDHPLPIGYGQTISQPYIVALMTSLLDLKGDECVLEVGTGSGYQAAILGLMAGVVHTIEIIPELTDRAEKLLRELGYTNITIHPGDGSLGWPQSAPFAGILVTAAAPEIPQPLLMQLAEHGRLILPVRHSGGSQALKVLQLNKGELVEHDIASVAFVPLRGKYG